MEKIKGLFAGKRKIVWVIVCLLLAGYGSGVWYFKDRFFVHTTVNGKDVSKLHLEEARSELQTLLSGYVVNISARESDSAQVTRADAGVLYVFDENFEQLLKNQQIWIWPYTFFSEFHHTTPTSIVLDEKKLEEKLSSLPFFQEEYRKEPKDAYISEYIAGSGYSIIPEYLGTMIKVEEGKAAVRQAILNLQEEVDLTADEFYENPKIYADDSTLNNALAQMNMITSTNIRYVGNTAIDGTISNGWISFDGENVHIDDNKIREFVVALADKYDTANRPRKFQSSAAGIVELPASKKGWILDQESEFQQIRAEITQGTTVEREPLFSQRGENLGESGFGGTYVEIDISNQHVYYYKDGAMILDSPIVTGNVARGMGTPAGVYSLRAKMRNAVLRGRDYAAPVSFWMPFNGGIGLHDASWRSSFGGNIYQYGGSHGCVNMPRSAAKVLYENIATGCPVICYKTDVRATTSVEAFNAARAQAQAAAEQPAAEAAPEQAAVPTEAAVSQVAQAAPAEQTVAAETSAPAEQTAPAAEQPAESAAVEQPTEAAAPSGQVALEAPQMQSE